MVGQKFTPENGQELWEVMEVMFTTDGRRNFVLQTEGHEETHEMFVDDFMKILKEGRLNVAET
jgi:hypothetical protein